MSNGLVGIAAAPGRTGTDRGKHGVRLLGGLNLQDAAPLFGTASGHLVIRLCSDETLNATMHLASYRYPKKRLP